MARHNTLRQRLARVFLWGVLLAVALPTHAQRATNRGLHAPPLRTSVTVDGRLDEWDLSGTIVCCKDVGALLDVESCRAAAMWDADNLYLSFHFRDSSPMQNRIDPVTMPGNGWRSDCVQLRCNMDGFVSHIDCWYYTEDQQPTMTIQYGRIGVEDGGQPRVDRPADPALLGAKQAFCEDEDGRGYIQEAAIPWAVLTLDGKAPTPEADLRLGLEMFWGDISAQGWPRSRVTDNLSDEATTVDFFWTSHQDWGKLIREDSNDLVLPPPSWQVGAKVEPKSTVPITFSVPRDSFATIAIEDGQGNRVKSLLGGERFAKGEHTVYWSGLNDRNELLPAGDYRWVGIYRDDIDVRWKMSFYQPNPCTPWNTADGTGAWGSDHGCMVAAAAGEELVYLAGLWAEAGNGLFAVNENGEKRWTVQNAGADRLAYAAGILYAYRATESWNPLGLADTGIMQFEAGTGKWLDLPGPDGKPVKRLDLVSSTERDTAQVDTPAPAGDAPSVIDGFAANAAGVYISLTSQNVIRSFDRSTFRLKREYPLEGAGLLFAPDDTTLLVTTPAGLQQISLDDGSAKLLTPGDFSQAEGITADSRQIWISFGAPAHQVRALSPSGHLMGTIGEQGGRTQNGWYDPNEGFFNPAGLAADSQGRLWVTENGVRPKRTSVWQDGKWQRDFIGDTWYGGGGLINPLDPTMAFFDAMRFEIDIDEGASRLVEIGMVMPEGAEEYGVIASRSDAGQTEYLNTYNGRAYVHNCRNERQIYRQREDERWALCVFIDPAGKLAWMDLNDDCTVQDDEVVRGGEGDDWGGADYWGNRPSQDLDLFFARGVDTPGLRLRLQRVTPGGTPVYDFGKFEPMAGECQNGIGLRDGSYNSGCAGERGEYFSEMRRIYPVGTDRRTFWFRGLNTGRWTPRLPEPGVVLYPFQAHGVADAPTIDGEIVCWVSDFGQRYLFTDDMLFVDQLFTDGRSSFEDWPADPQPDFLANQMAPGQESFHGFFTRTHDGRYLLTSGFTDCRVFELTGLDSLQRFAGGAVEVRPEHLARAEEIREFRLSEGKTRGSVTIATATGVLPDGKLSEWDRDNAVRIRVDDQRGAEVMASSDDTNLYIAWKVQDDSPMENTVEKWQLAFKGGDAVDLMFRAPGDELDAAQVRSGDLRLLITSIDGDLQAVLYRPVAERKQPYLFDAFEGANRANAVRMDEVRLAPEVEVALQRGEAGYIVEAALPWSLLGGRPALGAEFRMDFGVLFGDPAGSKTVIRAYWENRDANIVADIPSEAKLQPANWGKATLE